MPVFLSTGHGKAARSDRFSSLSTDQAHELVTRLKSSQKTPAPDSVDIKLPTGQVTLRSSKPKPAQESPKRTKFFLF